MVNLTDRDIWYAFGLSAVFVFGYLTISLLRHLLIAPLRKRRLMKQRIWEIKQQEMVRAKIFKAPEEEEKSLFVALLKKAGAQARLESLQRSLLQADISWSAGVFLSISALFALSGFYLGYYWQGSLEGGALAFLLGLLPFIFLRMKKNRKARLVETQMPDVMELLARSLRAGHTLPSAIELASQETPQPLGRELRLAYEEQRMGISMAEALRHMAERIDSADLRYFVTAILIQAETGGNLAEIMEKIGQLIRNRLRFKAKVRALSAEGRFSAIIASLMPCLVFLVLYTFKRDYIMNLLNEPMGRKMVVVALISMGIGILIFKKIVIIKV
jgi:tight adherence protein B